MATRTKPRRKPLAKRAAEAPQPAATAEIKAPSAGTLREPYLLLLTLLTAAAYIAFSFASDGFYQHDEAGHYLNMRAFWHDPNAILGNWAKPGYKLLYALPVLLGPTAVLVMNTLVAAFTCYTAYKLAETLGARMPLLAFALLAAQPLWVQLAFRNYSELPSALLLALTVLLHYKDRRILAALVFSYTAMIRQEFYPIIALYGAYLLYTRSWRAALALLVFPLVNHVWGWLATGDPLYLITQIVGTSGTYQEAYPRQGFGHYFAMSLTIFGALALTLLLVYLAQAVLYKKRVHGFVLIPLGLYFLAHSIFQLQAFPIGPSTGGNLRYMIVIAPLVAVLGGIAAERLPDLKSRAKLLAVLGPFVLVVLAFLRFEHNNIVLTGEPDPVPVLTTLAAVALVFLPLRRSWLVPAVAAVSLGIAVLAVEPYQRSLEDEAVARVADWYAEHNLEGRPLLANHTMFYYFYGKSREDFPEGAMSITGERVREAPVGTIILWDSHYSYRPRLRDDQVPHTYFLEHPDQFRPLFNPLVTPDRRFGIFGFEKIADAE